MKKNYVLAILFIMAVFFLLLSCKGKTIYVPVESSKNEYESSKLKDSINIIDITNIKDSVNIKDSIVYVVNENGDIIRKEVYKWKEKYQYNNRLLDILKTKYDSLLQTKIVVEKVPFPVVKHIEVNKLYNWQIALMVLGGVLIGYLGYRLFRFIKK